MKIKLLVALTLSLLPAIALAHPTDASLHAHAQLPDHASKMHSRTTASRHA